MQRYIIQRAVFVIGTVALLVGVLGSSAPPATAATAKVYTDAEIIGRLLVESGTARLWYVNPTDNERRWIATDTDFQSLIASTTVSITPAQLAKIPTKPAKGKKAPVTNYAGKFIKAVNNPAVWYVNPADNIRYAVIDRARLARAAQVIGLSIPGGQLSHFDYEPNSYGFDPLFDGVVYASYDGDTIIASHEVDRVTPLASVSKIMTALVLLDLELDWDATVTITPGQINYPRTLVGNDATSEVGLKAGDRVRISDLWASLLSASSNQSAIILVDNSGLTRAEFIARMNAKARELGLAQTTFYDPSGLDVRNVGTAREMAYLGAAAFRDARIADSTNLVDYTFTVQQADGTPRAVRVQNRNTSLLAFGPTGSKTGYLVEARSNVVLTKGRQTIVVLHADGLAERNSIVQRLLATYSISLN